MPTTRNPEAAYLVARELLTCAKDQVNETWSAEPDMKLLRTCVVWGSIAWDDCECGQLVVSIADQWPSDNFPNRPGPQSQQTRCGASIWVVQYLVNILRCSPVQDDQGGPPACEDLSAAARIMAVDSWAVRTGVACCLVSLSKDLNEQGATEITDYQIVGQPSQGPDGQCGGSELTVNIGMRNCFCPGGS